MKLTFSASCLWMIALFAIHQPATAQSAASQSAAAQAAISSHPGTSPGYPAAAAHPGGRVTDSLTGSPIAGATIEINGIGLEQTNEAGYFELRKLRPGSYTVKVTSVGYTGYEAILSVGTATATPVQIRLSPIRLFMQPVEVKAL